MNHPMSLYLLGLLAMATASSEQRIANHCGEVPFGEPQQPLLVPGPGWAQIAGTIEVPATKGGHHYYRVVCTEGCTYTFSLCGHGGRCNFDSGLSIWNHDMTEQLGCNMNGCGIGSELTWTAPSDGVYHLRIGGLEDSERTKTYTLAYGMGTGTCAPTPVERANWTLLKCMFRE